MSGALGSVRVQIVLFDDDVERQLRLAEGVAAAVRHARAGAGLERCVVRFGDSSATPCLDAADVDRIRDVLGDAADDVGYRWFDANLGSAGGSNALAADADEDAIWILNPDTYPSPVALTRLLGALGEPGVGVTEGRQIPVEHPKWYDPATGDTSWGSGCCLLVRTSVFRAVEGFDEHFFPMYCDDVDLCWRVRLAGHRVVHVPSAAVFHDKSIVGDGRLPISDFEERSGALARLFLLTRYGRADLVEEFRAWVDAHGAEPHRRAATEFDERAATGDVPEPLDGADGVAEFLDGHFGPLRFNYNA